MRSLLAYSGFVLIGSLFLTAQALGQASMSGALESQGNLSSTTADPLPSVSVATTPKTVEVRGIDLSIIEALATIAKQANLIIMTAPGTTGKIDIDLSDVTVDTALNSITRAGYLQWRKIWAIPGTSAQDLQQAIASADNAAKTNVVVGGTGGVASTAILTGMAAKSIVANPANLGLREIIWVYAPQVAVSARPVATAASVNAEAQEETNEPTPEKTYQAITEGLAKLDPADALNVLDQARADLIHAAGWDQEMAFVEPPPQTSMRGMFNQPRFVTPRPGRVRQYTPPNQGAIFRPYYYGY